MANKQIHQLLTANHLKKEDLFVISQNNSAVSLSPAIMIEKIKEYFELHPYYKWQELEDKTWDEMKSITWSPF